MFALDPRGWLDRLAGICFTLLVAAVAVYVAVRLIESVAAALVVIVAVIGGLVITVFVISVLWQRHQARRW